MKTALITGITGQDGVYLAEFLLAKGYIVHEIKLHTSHFNADRIDHLYSTRTHTNRTASSFKQQQRWISIGAFC